MASNLPGTIYQKVVSQFGAPPTWQPVGNFSVGTPGQKGDKGDPGRPGLSVQGPAGVSLLPRGFIDGLTLSIDGGTSDTIDFAAGACADSTNSIALVNTSTIVKKMTANWTAGTGNGGLFTGSMSTTTTYHCFLIADSTGRNIDAGFDTSATAANIPAGYSLFRRVGSIRTDSGPHIIAFHQYGDEFWWDTSILDITTTNPGSAAVTATLSIPTGLKVQAIITPNAFDSTQTCQIYTSSLDSADLTPAFSTDIETGAADTTQEGIGANVYIWSNTSGQIRYRMSRSSASLAVKIRTLGWVDQRGKNA